MTFAQHSCPLPEHEIGAKSALRRFVLRALNGVRPRRSETVRRYRKFQLFPSDDHGSPALVLWEMTLLSAPQSVIARQRKPRLNLPAETETETECKLKRGDICMKTAPTRSTEFCSRNQRSKTPRCGTCNRIGKQRSRRRRQTTESNRTELN
jgi:hypothetical protein